MTALEELGRQTIDEVTEPIDYGEVLRYLGYPEGVEPSSRVAADLDGLIDRASRLTAPRAIYVVLPVIQKDKRRLLLRSEDCDTEFRGAIGEFLGASQMIAVFIATAGRAVGQLVSQLLREGDDFGAMVASAVGSERAEAAEAEIIRRLRKDSEALGLVPTLPYSPGYCGMKLTEQNKLFPLLGKENVGVSLTPECLMQPIKSVSGLIGLGPADEVHDFGSPCDRCELHNCSMRR